MHELLQPGSERKQLLLGNEAIVRGALEGGVRFVAAYPGTPSSEIIDRFYQLAPEVQIYVEYSVNEKVSMETAACPPTTPVSPPARMNRTTGFMQKWRGCRCSSQRPRKKPNR